VFVVAVVEAVGKTSMTAVVSEFVKPRNVRVNGGLMSP
jgi:hypothetical protein